MVLEHILARERGLQSLHTFKLLWCKNSGRASLVFLSPPPLPAPPLPASAAIDLDVVFLSLLLLFVVVVTVVVLVRVCA